MVAKSVKIRPGGGAGVLAAVGPRRQGACGADFEVGPRASDARDADGTNGEGDAAGGSDAGADTLADGGEPARTCDVTAPFGSVADVAGVSAYSVAPRADELFTTGDLGVLRRATRSNRDAPLGAFDIVDSRCLRRSSA